MQLLTSHRYEAREYNFLETYFCYGDKKLYSRSKVDGDAVNSYIEKASAQGYRGFYLGLLNVLTLDKSRWVPATTYQFLLTKIISKNWYVRI
ncbi:MAG: hypothetical protein COV32_03170 [Candidatus Yonathbacteria bacterium CG10_big_fil_rev_8_21_14_0_10_43_136]|uniref:Uncharacterized protein n=1 Tax=Candidatus Yonathbacteria bacterium CG_4_10_14_0_8_um_filter_43_17 TaxID=1975099 RepID=A0A2M7Q6I1_9BACT|nr:MAG: hypothetical protein COW60_02765 [Candidatus Yonathbacteria bacterium CG17_big_fil_post_rev_8_21_14_2_50_43_9]PIR40467.1 MAG: hypothetical protein COV32_03170 [Candidatus Yonathbacteria bacterium CG10_big_fil_rev_8_21_14_0_10_43_136]PIX57044.1 MAG: hypothetical protein COZ48_02780 [Candidatus Yonathbacteria bacterium CG_4_10_14_3_um_filter_43_12]PIY58685.1 MAG: hypothetical protein COY98_00650 [Candidatus Yonathbacteria bacterium CG_4_10_14_0_8_um_filter_43_17]PJC22642.1 MAG: hypothetic